MKNTTEILKELKERFTTYKQCRDFWKREAAKEEELHHQKAQKESETLARENLVRMGLIVDIYKSISDIDTIELVIDLLKEESK